MKPGQIVVFTLDDLTCALPVGEVERVIYALEINRLPKAPEVIAGVINLGGRIIPVVDVRKRVGALSREIEPDDQFIIAATRRRSVALIVDRVTGVLDISPRQHTETTSVLPFAEYVRGIARIENEIILIYDLDQFLEIDEEKQLDEALSIK
jgi:purine-binding chemotaxis protein CheW